MYQNTLTLPQNGRNRVSKDMKFQNSLGPRSPHMRLKCKKQPFAKKYNIFVNIFLPMNFTIDSTIDRLRMVVRLVFDAEQCILNRLGIVDYTTMMRPTKQNRNSRPRLPRCLGEMVVRMRTVMAPSRGWCSVCPFCFYPIYACAVLKEKLLLHHITNRYISPFKWEDKSGNLLELL